MEQVQDPERADTSNNCSKICKNCSLRLHVEEDEFYEPFKNREVRHHFIRRVYTILFFHFVSTAGIIALLIYYEPMNDFLLDVNIWAVAIVGFALYLIPFFITLCVKKVRKKFPLNLILFITFTTGQAILVAKLLIFDEDSIKATKQVAFILALLLIAAVTILVTIFTCQTNYDFTACCGFIICVFLILILLGSTFGILHLYGIRIEILALVVAVAGIVGLFYSAYLMMVTQVIIGGCTKNFEIEPNDYTIGAFFLYLFLSYIKYFSPSRRRGLL